MDYREKAEKLNRMYLTYSKELYCLEEQISTQGETGVLLSLSEHEVPMFAGEFITALGLTTGRIANILKKLEQKKLIRREFLAEDKRRVVVSLTEKGKTVSRQRYEQMVSEQQKLLEHLGEEDSESLIRIFGDLMEFVKKEG